MLRLLDLDVAAFSNRITLAVDSCTLGAQAPRRNGCLFYRETWSGLGWLASPVDPLGAQLRDPRSNPLTVVHLHDQIDHVFFWQCH
jgi:hypothetical protein